MRKRFILIVPVIWICSLGSAFAQSLPDILIPSDLSALTMGPAASRAGAFASDNGISALPFAGKAINAGVSFVSWAPGATAIRSANAAVGIRLKRLAFAVSVKDNMARPYTAYNEDWQPSGEYQPVNFAASAALAYRLTEHFAVGVTGRGIHSGIAPQYEATAWCGDVSLTWHGSRLEGGASVCNIGTPVLYAPEGTPGVLPQMARVGVAANLWNCLRLGAEGDCYFQGGKFAFTAGAEYSFREMLFLRGGFHYGATSSPIPTYATFGASVRVSAVELGAGWLTGSEILGNSLMFSLCAYF